MDEHLRIFESNSSGWGLCLSHDTGEESPLIQIPFENVISADLARNSPEFCKLFPVFEMDDISVLASFLVFEGSREALGLPISCFRHYLSSLPTSGMSVVELSSDECERLFHPSPVRDAARNFERMIQNHFEYISGLLGKHAASGVDANIGTIFTYSMFKWAVCVLMSRAFDVEIGGEIRKVLVPMADMFNHTYDESLPIASYDFDQDCNSFVIRLPPACHEGEEVFISYGEHPNWKLVLLYGFAAKNNPFDSVDLQLASGLLVVTREGVTLDRSPLHLIELEQLVTQHHSVIEKAFEERMSALATLRRSTCTSRFHAVSFDLITCELELLQILWKTKRT